MFKLTTITSKRQITLPVKLFNKIGLKTGQKVVISEEDGKLIITPSKDLIEELSGIIGTPTRLKNKTPKKILELSKNKYKKSAQT